MKITEQEFMELYGEEKVSFSNYYKYRFHFRGTTKEGYSIYMTWGGNANDIYKFYVESSYVFQLNSYSGWNEGIVRDKDGKEIHWFEEE
jgi:hypothetical protein